MQREVTLEEYFTLKADDRLEFWVQVCQRLWEWEPHVRQNIEEVLKLGMHKKHKDGPIAAAGLLALVKSLELLQALRRHFKDAHKDEQHQDAICILLDAVVQTPYLDIQHKMDTLVYYTNNPRYTRSERVDKMLFHCLDVVRVEFLENVREIEVAMRKIEPDAILGETYADTLLQSPSLRRI